MCERLTPWIGVWVWLSPAVLWSGLPSVLWWFPCGLWLLPSVAWSDDFSDGSWLDSLDNSWLNNFCHNWSVDNFVALTGPWLSLYISLESMMVISGV